jgi:hypothetical protein
MNWTDALDNPEHLKAFFDSMEGLESISLFEVVLDRDGPELRLRADLPRFPDRPSHRWSPTANQAQITIGLVLASGDDLEIRGWATTMNGTLSMSRNRAGEVMFSFQSDGVVIRGRAVGVWVHKVTAYMRDVG